MTGINYLLTAGQVDKGILGTVTRMVPDDLVEVALESQ